METLTSGKIMIRYIYKKNPIEMKLSEIYDDDEDWENWINGRTEQNKTKQRNKQINKTHRPTYYATMIKKKKNNAIKRNNNKTNSNNNSTSNNNNNNNNSNNNNSNNNNSNNYNLVESRILLLSLFPNTKQTNKQTPDCLLVSPNTVCLFT